MLKHIRWMAGFALAALLLLQPEAAVNGAREAMAQWYYAVAPSLFPFMVLMPLLTCDEALGMCEAALGGVMRRLFRLPGSAAPALCIGMLAGSPAGCVAAARSARQSGMGREQLECLAAACCGLSPAFLLGGIGTSMLGSASRGWILLRTQLAVQLLLLTRARWVKGDQPLPEATSTAGADCQPMRTAVLAVLAVCGYMTAFGAASGAFAALAGKGVGRVLLCLMDISSGAYIISKLPIQPEVCLVAMSCAVGFGGACICAQNLSALRNCGVRLPRFIAARLLAAALSGLLTALQLSIVHLPVGQHLPGAMPGACLLACLMAIPVVWRLKKPAS